MMVLLVGKKVKEVCNIIDSSSQHVYLCKPSLYNVHCFIGC